MARKPKHGPGRPQGSQQQDAAVATIEPSRCVNPQCLSTRRSDYWGKTVQEYAGLTPGGMPYTHIVRRRCKCLDCGQVRVDKTFENEPV